MVLPPRVSPVRTINWSAPEVSTAQMPVLFALVTPAVALGLSEARRMTPAWSVAPPWSARASSLKISKIAPSYYRCQIRARAGRRPPPGYRAHWAHRAYSGSMGPMGLIGPMADAQSGQPVGAMPSTARKSASTISFTRAWNFTVGSQPSWRLALAGSPISRSTSAGRS